MGELPENEFLKVIYTMTVIHVFPFLYGFHLYLAAVYLVQKFLCKLNLT